MAYDRKGLSMLDRIDLAIRAERLAKRQGEQQPLVGDFVRFSSGQIERFSWDGDRSIQTAPGGSFYLGGSGLASFSGSLNPPVPKASLTLIDEVVEGAFWFFHHGSPGAGCGVHFTLPCKVFVCSAPYQGFVRL